MTVVVGVGPQTARAVLQLAERIAGLDEPIVVCGVVLDTWDGPSLSTGLDPHYRDVLVKQMRQALDEYGTGAQSEHITTTVRVGGSVPEQLLAEAEQHDASVLVVGSSTRAAFGRISLGSISDQLVHSSTVPVAITPNHLDELVPDTISRLVVALQPADASFAAAEAGPVAQALDADVELVTFSLHPWPRVMHTEEVEWDGLLESWRSQTQGLHSNVAAELEDNDVTVTDSQIINAHRWADAMSEFSWQRGDMLVIFSSKRGPVSRVFLGSNAARILRLAPVPTVVLPRSGR